MRIVIAGGPRTGKTTFANGLAKTYSMPVRHTDDLIASHAWSEASDEVARWLSDGGTWIIEGVATVRGLRKWLAANPDGVPFDKLYVTTRAHEELTPGQQTMGRGTATLWREIAPELLRRRAVIEFL